jgi:hypothetical protein
MRSKKKFVKLYAKLLRQIMNRIDPQTMTNPDRLELKAMPKDIWFLILNHIYKINKNYHYLWNRKLKNIFFFSQTSKAAFAFTQLFIQRSPAFLETIAWRKVQYNKEKTRSDFSINFFRKNEDGSFYCSNTYLPKLMKFLPRGESANLHEWQRIILTHHESLGGWTTTYDRIEDFLTFEEKYIIIASSNHPEKGTIKHITIVKGEDECFSYEVGKLILYALIGNTFYFWDGSEEFSEIDMKENPNTEPKDSIVLKNYIDRLHKEIDYKTFVQHYLSYRGKIQFSHFFQQDRHLFLMDNQNIYETQALGDIIRTYQNPAVVSSICVSSSWLVAQNNSTFNIFCREEAGENLSPLLRISLPTEVLNWFLDKDFLIVVGVHYIMTYDLRQKVSYETMTKNDPNKTIQGAWTNLNQLSILVSEKIEEKEAWGKECKIKYQLSIHQEPIDTHTWQALKKDKAAKSVKIQPEPIPHSKDLSIKSLSEGNSNCTTPKIIAVASLIFSIISLTAFFTITFNHQVASWLDSRWISSQNIAYTILSTITLPSLIASGIAYYPHKKPTTSTSRIIEIN